MTTTVRRHPPRSRGKATREVSTDRPRRITREYGSLASSVRGRTIGRVIVECEDPRCPDGRLSEAQRRRKGQRAYTSLEHHGVRLIFTDGSELAVTGLPFAHIGAPTAPRPPTRTPRR